jgi:hypothetical protein
VLSTEWLRPKTLGAEIHDAGFLCCGSIPQDSDRPMRGMRPVTRADHRCIDFAQSRVQQRRVPQSPIDPVNPAKSDSCQTRGRVPARRLSVKFEAQQSGFRSLCGRELRSTFSLRAQSNLPVEPVSGRALFRDYWPPTYLWGEPTLFRCCWEGSRSQRIFQAVFFDLRRLYRGFFRPITARLTPPRSVLAGPTDTSPAAAIKSATVSL